MKITFTNLDFANIVNYANTEGSIATNTTAKLPIMFAWKFKKNMKKITDAYEVFTKLQEEIMNSYATDEFSYEKDGERYVKEEFMNEYQKKMNDLLVQTTELNIDTVKFEDIANAGLELSIPELNVISFMIEEEIEETNNEEIEIVSGEVE